MRSRLERLARRWWYERARAPILLRPLAALYSRLARPGPRPRGRPPLPVIVVGNLTAGGSGKTPVVEALVHALAAEGMQVGIVSRGYGGEEPGHPHRVKTNDEAARVGDEALALHRSTGVPVWVCRNRAAALDAAVAAGVDVVISDDGLQHAAMPRSFEICVIDGRRGFGNGALLPAGPLREPIERLQTVDAVLVKAPVRAALPSSVLAVAQCFELQSTGLQPCRGDAPPPAPGQAVDAVAGIADPEAFFEDLASLGHAVRAHPIGDHQPIDRQWLDALEGPVVVTSKDAARIGAVARDDLFVAGVEAILPPMLIETLRRHVREFPA